MPYITEDLRDAINEGAVPETSGELNYAFSALIKLYLKSKPSLKYQHINDVIGALEGAKLEFYRMVAAPYEDQKMEENGKVY